MRRTRDALTPAELDRLLEAGGQPHALWLLLAADAGLRNAEIRSITPDHVLTSGLIYVRGKGGVERTVPATTRLINALRMEDLNRIAARTPQQRPYVHVQARTLQVRFRKLAREAGVYLPGRCVHTLRHSYATRILAAGVPLHVLQRLLGHANVATTSVYLHASQADLHQAARALELADLEAVETVSQIDRIAKGPPGQTYLFRPGQHWTGARWRTNRA